MQQVTELKWLGVTFDPALNFDSHAARVVSEIHCRTRQLLNYRRDRRLRQRVSGVSFAVITNAWRAMVEPVISYGVAAYAAAAPDVVLDMVDEAINSSITSILVEGDKLGLHAFNWRKVNPRALALLAGVRSVRNLLVDSSANLLDRLLRLSGVVSVGDRVERLVKEAGYNVSVVDSIPEDVIDSSVQTNKILGRDCSVTVRHVRSGVQAVRPNRHIAPLFHAPPSEAGGKWGAGLGGERRSIWDYAMRAASNAGVMTSKILRHRTFHQSELNYDFRFGTSVEDIEPVNAALLSFMTDGKGVLYATDGSGGSGTAHKWRIDEY